MLRGGLAVFCVFAATAAPAAEPPALRDADRIRLAEAFRIADQLGEEVWPGWEHAPFGVLLVTDHHEFLIHQNQDHPDFQSLAYDSMLHSFVLVRIRNFSTNLLSTFPALGGQPLVVIGLPENTNRNSSTWVTTVLHEHFHQLQMSDPSYYPDVNALNLARGDDSGQWMLDYPFPYDDPVVREPFDSFSSSLHIALKRNKKPDFTDRVDAFMMTHGDLEALLRDDEYRYLSFQLWQEGVARYVEYRIAELAGKHYQPTEKFRNLEDYVPFKKVAREMRTRIYHSLNDPSLEEKQRVAFYPLGAAIAILLDEINPAWKEDYFSTKFYLEDYF